jgi:hypothetical protein
MMLRTHVSAAIAGAVALGCALVSAAPASALGLKDCSDKYSAAKTAGTAGKKTFAEFMKSDCGADAKPVAAPAAAAAAPAATTAPAAKPESRAERRRAAKAAAAAAAPAATAPAAASSTAVFPSAIGAAYKDKKPSRARMATCLDQYRANKATNSNGGLRWIQKGGGYYSQCNKRLKG